MRGEEDVEQVAQVQLFGIITDADRLGMAGISVADLAISRVGDLAADIAAFDRLDADHVLEHGLGAPETAAGERDELSHGLVTPFLAM